MIRYKVTPFNFFQMLGLGVLNKLKNNFQEANADITNNWLALEVTISTLSRWFLRKETFAKCTRYILKF